MIRNDTVNIDIETNIVAFEKFGFQRPQLASRTLQKSTLGRCTTGHVATLWGACISLGRLSEWFRNPKNVGLLLYIYIYCIYWYHIHIYIYILYIFLSILHIIITREISINHKTKCAYINTWIYAPIYSYMIPLSAYVHKRAKVMLRFSRFTMLWHSHTLANILHKAVSHISPSCVNNFKQLTVKLTMVYGR